ncbi:hypothetical protein [Azospirillum canadense]|uniref:hypothetical protein n=1 Tax=Azospirillum canadense TaxID=403962 RepID=UPI0022277C20|nr:hypothetical protein [Azospirillum canadense]MCW2239095.1 hypothetical protein [Azospirillum canadense]
MAPISVQMGDRFTRTAGSPKIYVVTALVDKPGHLPHARLLLEDGMPSDELLVSVDALGARKQHWRPVP